MKRAKTIKIQIERYYNQRDLLKYFAYVFLKTGLAYKIGISGSKAISPEFMFHYCTKSFPNY